MSVHQPLTTFPFLRLPPELRIQIYNYILPTQVIISQPRPCYEKSCHPWALANICRSVRDEYLTTFYSRARFFIHLRDRGRAQLREAYYDWIFDLDPYLADLIKHLVVYRVAEVEPAMDIDRTFRVDLDHAEDWFKVERLPRQWEEHEEVLVEWLSGEESLGSARADKQVAMLEMGINGARSRGEGKGLGKEAISWLVETLLDSRFRSFAMMMDVKVMLRRKRRRRELEWWV
ncbi:MAG: hypothetical protein Q9170_003537 [Blastenia crenularia]